jgi:hypothetical protein
MNKDEQKKYELVLTETALLVFRGHQNPTELLILVGVPEGLGLGEIILNAVSRGCGITSDEVRVVSNLRVSIF